MNSLATATALSTLAADLTGALILPGDDAYDEARLPWNRAVDQRPVAIAVPVDIDDVRVIVTAAASAGLGVTVQPNGHGAAGDLDGVILIRPAAFDEITIDAEARSARVGAGVNWGRVLTALDGTGLLALAGSNPEVNVVGYSIGGGHSMFSSAYGLAARSVTAIELVDGTGAFRRVTEQSDPELFWALRGGGGLFGVITSIEFALHPGGTFFGGSLTFPVESAADVITAAFELGAELPILGLDTSLARFPDRAELPDHLRGRTLASIAFVHIGDPASGSAIAERLRQVAPVVADSLTELTIGELAAVAAEPVDPMPFVDWGGTVDGFGRESAAALVDAFLAGADRGLARVGVRVLGGAVADPVGAETAVIGAITAPALISATAVAFTPDLAAGADAALQPLRDLAVRYPTTGMVPTFLGAGTDLRDAFDAATLARLAAVKEQVDPDGVIRSNRGLG